MGKKTTGPAKEKKLDNMLTWLLASMSLDTTREMAVSPETPVAEGEKVLGVIEDEELRLLFGLLNFVTREKIRLSPDLGEILFSGIFGREVDVSPDFMPVYRRHRVVSTVFWASIQEMFPIGEGEGSGHGLRENWQVVALPDDPDDSDDDSGFELITIFGGPRRVN